MNTFVFLFNTMHDPYEVWVEIEKSDSAPGAWDKLIERKIIERKLNGTPEERREIHDEHFETLFNIDVLTEDQTRDSVSCENFTDEEIWGISKDMEL
jgi:hypothetical protein